jgi:hypothetical protein
MQYGGKNGTYSERKKRGKMDRKILWFCWSQLIGILLTISECLRKTFHEFMLEVRRIFEHGSNLLNLNPGYLLVLEGRRERKTPKLLLRFSTSQNRDCGYRRADACRYQSRERGDQDDVLVEISETTLLMRPQIPLNAPELSTFTRHGIIVHRRGAWEVGVEKGIAGVTCPELS